MAFLLTGMGADGARGLHELRKKGASTFIQDEKSCVVFGMPREAAEIGAAQYSGSLPELRKVLDRAIFMRSKRSA